MESKGFQVIQEQHPDRAIEFAKKEKGNLCAIILDVMMRSGGFAPDETNQGLRTGMLVFRELQKICPSVPVVVLTNVSNEETLAGFRDAENVQVLQKLRMPPFELTELLTQIAK